MGLERQDDLRLAGSLLEACWKLAGSLLEACWKLEQKHD